MTTSTPKASTSTPAPGAPLDSPSLPNGKDRQSLALPQSTSSAAQPWTSPMTAMSFTSLLPIVDGMLGTLSGLAESQGRVDGVEAGRAVVGSARDLFSSLERMKTAALELPGGHLSTERIEELTAMMRTEAERKRDLLRRVEGVKMPIAEQLQRSAEGATGEDQADGDDDKSGGI